MQPLPRGPAALDAILAERPCELARPGWIGVVDERDLSDEWAQYAVHCQFLARGRSAAPLRIALCRLAAAFCGREGWSRVGFVRLSDYARERLGISSRELQELARVGARFDELPALERAFARGVLRWSHVALLAGSATPDDVEAWIGRARGQTVRSLRQEIRDHRKAERKARKAADPEASGESGDSEPEGETGDGDAELPLELFQLVCSAQARSQWHRVRELARRMAGSELSAGECIELMSAEVLSALELEPDVPPPPDRSGRSWRPPPRRIRGEPPTCLDHHEAEARTDAADASAASHAAAFLRSLLDGIEEADAHALDRRMRKCLRAEQRLDAQLGALLSILSQKGTHRCFEIESASRYAEELVGLSQRKAQMLLRIEKGAQQSPALARAYRSGQLSYVRAHTLVPLVYCDFFGCWMEHWVERARQVSVRQLRDDVERSELIGTTDPETWNRTGGLPELLDAAVPEDAGGATGARTSASSTVAFVAERGVIALFWAVLWSVRRRVERVTGRFPDEGEAFERMLEHVLDAWGADAKTRREHRIYARDGWRCAVPCCTSRRRLQAHHIVPRGRGGGDEETNRITLCAGHHLRGVHAGVVEITGKAPAELLFRLGVRPDGPPLVVYRSDGSIVEEGA